MTVPQTIGDGAWGEVAHFLTQLGAGPGADPSRSVPRFVVPAVSWAVLAGYAFLAAFRGRSPGLRNLLLAGLGVTVALYVATGVSWAEFVSSGRAAPGSGPRLEFALHWGDLAFRVAGVAALGAVVAGLVTARGHGIAPRIAAAAFTGFLLDHLLMLVNILQGGRHAWILSPIRHNLHMWAVPILLGVYWYELTETVRQGEARLQQAQKLESLGLLAGGVAHDFNNLLTIVGGNLDVALLDLPPGNLRTLVAEARQGSTRAVELTAQRLAYAGKGAVHVAPVDVSGLAAETALLVRSSLPRGTHLVLGCPERLPPVRADATLLRRQLMNLLLNAAQAMTGRTGEIAVRTAVRDCGKAEFARSVAGEAAPAVRYFTVGLVHHSSGRY